MLNKVVIEDVVLVNCVTSVSTRIAGYNINPNRPPVEIPIAIYNTHKATFDHYVSEQVIVVTKPSEKGFQEGIERIETMRQIEEENIPRGQRPLKPFVMDTRTQRNAEQYDADITVKTPKELANIGTPSPTCVAVTKAGDRCAVEKMKGFKVCASHLKMIRLNKDVKDISGNRIELSMSAVDGK